MTLIVVKLYKNNNMMIKNKRMLAYELLYPDLFTNLSIELINIEFLKQLDEGTINHLFSDREFKYLFIYLVNQRMLSRDIQYGVSGLGLAFYFYENNKKNTPFFNDKDVVLAILNTLNPELTDNRDYYKVCDYFRMLSKKLKNDMEVVSSAINLFNLTDYAERNGRSRALRRYHYSQRYLPRIYSHTKYNKFPAIGSKLADDENFMRYEVIKNPNVMSLASERLKNNMDLMTLCAHKQNGQEAYLIAGKRVKNNKDFIKTCVENGLFLWQLKHKERSDYDIGFAAISCDGENIQHACNELKKDKKISLFALRNGARLENLDDIFKDDEEIAIESIRLNHFNFESVSPRLRKDSNFIAKLLRENGDIFRFLSSKYRGDKNVIMEAAKSSKGDLMFRYIPLSLKRDKDFIFNLVKLYASENKNAYKNALDSNRNVHVDEAILFKHHENKKYISRIAEIYPPIVKGYRFLGKKIYKKVARKILQANPFLFKYCDSNDESLALIALKQEPKMASYLGYRLKNKAKFKKYI